MGVTRIVSGSAAVVLSGADEAWVRDVVDRASKGAIQAIENALEPIAESARREWYGPHGVTRETGKSGDIQVMTTVDTDRNRVRVSVGSTDTSTVGFRKENWDKGLSGQGYGGVKIDAYRVRFIHRPWSNTLRAKAVTQGEWWAWKRKGLPALPPPGDKWWSDGENGKGLSHSKWYIQVVEHPDKETVPEGTGRMLPDLVTKPTKARIKSIAPEIAQAIAGRVNRG